MGSRLVPGRYEYDLDARVGYEEIMIRMGSRSDKTYVTKWQRRFIVVAVSLLLANTGCASTGSNLNRPSGAAISNSVGNPDIAKYKTFTVGNLDSPGTPQYLRDAPILQSIAFRFQQEGFKYVNNIDRADFMVTVSLIDAVGQDYVPPRTYTSVSYDPGTTTTQTTGMATGFGNFVNLQGTSTSTSTASATASTVTTGGYFVPNYGIAMAINIYDVKTKQLIWSGAGARRSNIENIYPAVNDIILQLIDERLITPSYISGQRANIRMAYTRKKQNEYLRPEQPWGLVNYKNGLNKVSTFSSLLLARGPAGEMLMLTITLKNDADTGLNFDPIGLKVFLVDEALAVLSKSDISAAAFDLNRNKPTRMHGYDLGSALAASIINGIANARFKQRTAERDRNVRMVYEKYLDKHTIKAGDSYTAFAYIAGFAFIPDNAKVRLLIPVNDETAEADYVYEPNWMTPEQLKKTMATPVKAQQ